jgi:hypothetical protein
LLGNKINTDGKHELHKRGDHTIYAHVNGKKISHISVTHKTKGEVPVKKYKTNKKVVQLGVPGFAAGETGKLGEPVSYQLAQQIVWLIGWAYNGPRRGILVSARIGHQGGSAGEILRREIGGQSF